MDKPYIWRYVLFLVGVLAFFYVANKLPIGQHLSLGLAQGLDVIQAPVRWVDNASLWLKKRQYLQQELIAAREIMAQRRLLLEQNQSLKEENKQLRLLLKTTRIQGYQWRAARVLGRSPEEKSQHLILEAKSQRDDVVIASTGLVGLVDQSQQGMSVVHTILDGSLAVPVTLANSSLAALVRGAGNHLNVDFIPLNQAPKVGDILQTSGAGGVFPPGISVAYVIDIKPVAGRVFAKVKAVPTAHWQREAWLAIASRHQVIVKSEP